MLISVDDVGQFLALTSKDLILGHRSDGQADLPFLANVGARHARLQRRDSLGQGSVWWIERLGQERISINAVELEAKSPLAPGDLVRLSDNLALVFRSPDPASQSALLELQGAEECLGAQRVLLFAEGAGGRCRIGSGAQRMIRVPNLESQLCLEVDARRLCITCSEPLLSWAGLKCQSQVDLDLPLAGHQSLSLGASRDGRPAFSLGIGMPQVQALPAEDRVR